jgi:hypothetical protein
MKIMISNQQSEVKHFPLGSTPDTLAAYALAPRTNVNYLQLRCKKMLNSSDEKDQL